MTQKISIGPVGADYTIVSAALSALTPGAFIEPVVLEVHADTTPEDVVVPATLIPSASNPLVIQALRTSSVETPQPRLDRPEMSSLTIQSVWTTVNGFKVSGDVDIDADSGVSLFGNIVESGKINLSRAAETTGQDILLASNEIRKSPKREGIFVSNLTGVRILHNTVLQRREDAVSEVDGYAIYIRSSSVEAKNNTFASYGENMFSIRMLGDPTSSTLDNNAFVVIGDDAVRFIYSLDDAAAPLETNDQNQWAQVVTTSTNNKTDDPEFKEVDGSDVDLDVSNTSPLISAADALAEVAFDVRGERRPADYVTIGAHDHSEVITEGGRQRLLELLAGISSDPVNKCVLADSGDSTLLGEYNAPDSEDLDELFTPITVEDISAADGTVTFKPVFQVTQPVWIEMEDATADRADEAALAAQDNLIFMVKRMPRIPFDSSGFLKTQIKIPISFVGVSE